MVIDLELRKPVEGADYVVEEGIAIPSDYRTDGRPMEALRSNGSLPPPITPPKPSGKELGLAPIGQPHKPDEAFNSLLNEITLPLLKAEDETKPDGKWEPKELRPRHREMMRRILEGATYVEIAEEMGISTQSVMLVCSSAMFKEELKGLEEALNLNVIRRAEELSNEALDRLKMLMRRAKSEALQASCAERVLGIAGYSKIEKKQVQVISGEDVIRELNRRRRERSNSDAIYAQSNAGQAIAGPEDAAISK
jgi:hypothetical protein